MRTRASIRPVHAWPVWRVRRWTPALEARSGQLDGRPAMGHGLVFSIFMLSKMAGSQARLAHALVAC